MSGYHVGSGDCLQELSIKLAESDIDPTVFDEAWRSLGVVVAALYRTRHAARPTLAADLEALKQQVSLTNTTDEDHDPHTAAVELGRQGGLKGGPARAATLTPERRSAIAQHAAETRWSGRSRKLTAREAWERSHGPNLPFPGGDAVSA